MLNGNWKIQIAQISFSGFAPCIHIAMFGFFPTAHKAIEAGSSMASCRNERKYRDKSATWGTILPEVSCEQTRQPLWRIEIAYRWAPLYPIRLIRIPALFKVSYVNSYLCNANLPA